MRTDATCFDITKSLSLSSLSLIEQRLSLPLRHMADVAGQICAISRSSGTPDPESSLKRETFCGKNMSYSFPETGLAYNVPVGFDDWRTARVDCLRSKPSLSTTPGGSVVVLQQHESHSLYSSTSS